MGALVHQVLTPRTPHFGAEDAIVGLVVADRLHEHAGQDPLRPVLDELEDERAANAAANDGGLVDTQVVQDSELIVGVHPPRIARIEWAARATSITLVHGDDAELVAEGLQRIQRHAAPEIDGGVQTTGRQEQERWTTAALLVMDRRVTTLNRRHQFRAPPEQCLSYRVIGRPLRCLASDKLTPKEKNLTAAQVILREMQRDARPGVRDPARCTCRAFRDARPWRWRLPAGPRCRASERRRYGPSGRSRRSRSRPRSSPGRAAGSAMTSPDYAPRVGAATGGAARARAFQIPRGTRTARLRPANLARPLGAPGS